MTLYLLIALMVLLWSGNYVVAKIALRELPPLLVMGWRGILASVVILPVYLMRRRAGLTLREVGRLIGLGIFGVALNQFFFIVGMSRTTVAHSALMIGLSPVLVLLIAAWFGMEKITATKIAGMAIALVGVAILQSTRDGSPSMIGDFWVFLGALTFSIFTVMGKRSVTKVDAIEVNTFAYVGLAIALLPTTLLEMRAHPMSQFSLTAWLCLLYMAAFSSVLCYVIYYYAIGRMSASRVSALSYFQPVLASLMAVAWLGEKLTVPLVAGGSVIFAGVILTERG